jgi:hypothetical protein
MKEDAKPKTKFERALEEFSIGMEGRFMIRKR